MGQSISTTAIRRIVDEKMTDAEWAPLLGNYAKKIRDGFWPQDYLDFLVQKFDKFGGYDIYDAYAFIRFHLLVSTGKLVGFNLGVGNTPCSDVQVGEMNSRLGNLPFPFSAIFWGEKADSDGELVWSVPIYTDNTSVNPDFGSLRHVEIRSGKIPLEVGTTKGETSLLHILSEGGLARWPYGYNRIYVWLQPERFGACDIPCLPSHIKYRGKKATIITSGLMPTQLTLWGANGHGTHMPEVWADEGGE